jgi:organic radical activating enzyme
MLAKKDLYRFPWSLNDNPIGWVEVSDICNIHCKGCYRSTLGGHKTLEQLQKEVLFMKEWRNIDNITLAGGEPLIYPHLFELIKFIREQKLKVHILSNGLALTPELVKKLKKAKVNSMTIHMDRNQKRADRDGQNTDLELCALRERYAKMIYKIFPKLILTFGLTVYNQNLEELPEIVRWGVKNMKYVNGFVFIMYRGVPIEDGLEYINNKGNKVKVEVNTLGYTTDELAEINIETKDVYDRVKRGCPRYEPAAYLGGTMTHEAFKWTAGVLIGADERIFGALGPKSMELIQSMHHFFFKSYMVYSKKKSFGRRIFLLGLFDKHVRRAFRQYLKSCLLPWRLFRRIRLLSIGTVQAPDLYPDGRTDMCDACPDITYWDGKLVHSCRLDEWRMFGGYLQAHMLGKRTREEVMASKIEELRAAETAMAGEAETGSSPER